MTNKEVVNWLISLSADIGKIEHQDLWHYEQALLEIKDMLEAEPERLCIDELINQINQMDRLYIQVDGSKKVRVVPHDNVIRILQNAELGRKTGKWISKLHPNWGKWGIYIVKCSECGFFYGEWKWNFCPNCGVRMEVKE